MGEEGVCHPVFVLGLDKSSPRVTQKLIVGAGFGVRRALLAVVLVINTPDS